MLNIPSILESLGIDFIDLEDEVYGSTITSAEEGSRKFPIVFYEWTAEDEKNYVRLIISPFIERPSEGWTFDFFEQILDINEQLPRAKFLLDGDGDLGFALDIDVEEWSLENLARALDVLGPFANYCYEKLESLAGQKVSDGKLDV